jgi:hydrogenase expression/formation protein HypC
MCLAAAGRILEVTGEGLERSALVDLAGRARPINLAMVPDAVVGDWVKVHSGYAFEVMTPEDAAELLDLTDEIGRHT